MKTNLRFLAVAAAILSVLSCTREIENIDREEASQTLHYVHFIADAPETKTNLEVSLDGTVSYSWTASDECIWISEGDCRWTITNKTNGETAQEITAALTDGVLALTAGFSSEVTAGDVLFAQYNKSVSSTQNYVLESKYHQESDVMISNEIVVQDRDNSNTDYYFSFKRRVAFAKMTLKGLNPNDYVSTVTIESDKAIAGTYNSETDSFDSSSSNSIVINDILEKIDENGTATIYFAVVPVEDANLTVTVETVTEEAAAANTYRKTFARPISFVTGDVRAFGVAMTKLVDPERGWVKTDISKISASDIVVIVGSNYGIRNDEGTSTSPDVVSVTISNNKITSVVPNNIKWNISGNSTDGYVFYPNGDSTKWLYCSTTAESSSNNNIRVGTGARKQWKPDVNGYYVNTVGGTTTYVQRVLSIYNNSEWRSYINTKNNPQKLEFYVLQSAGSSEGGGETGGKTNYFVKVTSAPTDWSGEYLIVCEDQNVAFDGSLNTLDVASNNVSVTITENRIEADDNLLNSTFTINAEGTTIQSKSGYYIGGKSTKDNGIQTSKTTSYNHTLSINAAGEFVAYTTLSNNSNYLRCNPNSGNQWFRYYKSSSYTIQKAVQLYKLENRLESVGGDGVKNPQQQ